MASVGTGTVGGDGRARVLFIKDEAAGRDKVAKVLREAGFDVMEVSSGLAGIEAATTSHPDLLLVDLHLPDIDGSEVAAKLRKLGMEGLPIVAIGLHRQGAAAERGVALTAGCTGTIEGTPNLETLPGLLREFLAGKRDRLGAATERRYLRVYTEALAEKLEAKVRELTHTNERLKHIDAFKTEFMQSISHELSTPLTPLAGYLKIMQSEKLGPLTDKQKKVVEAMLQSSERLARTIDNLSDFAVLETGDYHVRSSDFDLVTMLQKLVDDIAVQVAKPKRVHVALLAPKKELKVAADEVRLAQAVGNLIDNAIRYSPHGAEVLAELRERDGALQISVYDQGSGVPTAEKEKIFEPFFHSQGARHVAVSGLGLPVARKIVEAHGGKLFVESPPMEQPDQTRHFSGARFVIELPLKKTEA